MPEWLLPLLELALHEAPFDGGLPQPLRLALTPDEVEHSGAWLQLAMVAEAEADAEGGAELDAEADTEAEADAEADVEADADAEAVAML